ncbi:cell filamentation protein Fic [Bifidobacterium hapali]|uniref:Cell filamentation protein Fic n=1 Tax=Bifidobacterium hapali TaxID=1630172 RepID=A0A261FUP0_9BIFI|nr:Fic family protein [Bifidobacterium hapali]OZG62879.1 cell filamentation protein Fic [Bifidobacterium hapali]
MKLDEWLRHERDQKLSHGLYYNMQLAFAYNSNHMEGSTLTPEQTAQLYDTGELLPQNGNDLIRADDVIETTNHFRAFDWMLDHVDDPVDKRFVCTLHAILKRGTRQETDPDRNVGGWKILPNVINAIQGIHTVLPADVPQAMPIVFHEFAQLVDEPYAIAHAHWMFETTHPFSDDNGRVGRLVLFKELMRIGTVPPLIRDKNRAFYIRGLSQFPTEPGYLIDTLLSERDYCRQLIDMMATDRVDYTYVDEWHNRHDMEQRYAANPAVNPYIRERWDEHDMYRRVPSERFVLGAGFIPPSD